MKRLSRVINEELAGLHLRLLLARLLLAPLPIHVGGRVRALILRMAGFSIEPGCVICDMPIITGGSNLYQHLTIGQGSWINIGCLLDLGAPITIGKRVAIGHDVMILTSSHVIGPPESRAAALYTKPVRI